MSDRFNQLSRAVNICLENGTYDILFENWIEMAKICHEEEKYRDELKILMLAFHIYLERNFMLYMQVIGKAKLATEKSEMTPEERFELYQEVAFDTAGRLSSFSCKDSYNVFDLCVQGRMSDAVDIVERAIMTKRGY